MSGWVFNFSWEEKHICILFVSKTVNMRFIVFKKITKKSVFVPEMIFFFMLWYLTLKKITQSCKFLKLNEKNKVILKLAMTVLQVAYGQ